MVSILCLRCIGRVSCRTVAECVGFNSLFEMRSKQGRKRGRGCGVSILCLRCLTGYAVVPLTVYGVSILCLRCVDDVLHEAEMYFPRARFNSLFEMHSKYSYINMKLSPSSSFNSLFEMPGRGVWRCAGPQCGGCFNSLFEMPGFLVF